MPQKALNFIAENVSKHSFKMKILVQLSLALFLISCLGETINTDNVKTSEKSRDLVDKDLSSATIRLSQLGGECTYALDMGKVYTMFDTNEIIEVDSFPLAISIDNYRLFVDSLLKLETDYADPRVRDGLIYFIYIEKNELKKQIRIQHYYLRELERLIEIINLRVHDNQRIIYPSQILKERLKRISS